MIRGRGGDTGVSIVGQPTNRSLAGATPEETAGAGDARSGRPVFDRRGTTVWEWRTAPGVYSRDASTTRVQKLQAPELTLEKTAIVKQPPIEEPRLNMAPCGGFNPYDSAPARNTTPVATPRSGRTPSFTMPPTRPVALPPSRPSTLLERLSALFARK